MGERLRNVLNWVAFLAGIYWLSLTPISMMLDWYPPKVLLFFLGFHFIWVPPMVSIKTTLTLSPFLEQSSTNDLICSNA